MNPYAANGPLSAKVLAQANVPIEDALWLHRRPSPASVIGSLTTERGITILKKVRDCINPASMGPHQLQPN